MPSPIVHLSAGYAAYRVATHTPGLRKPDVAVLSGSLLLSLLPDFDAIAGILFGDFGRFHNSGSHSLLVAVTVAALTGAGAWLAGSRWAGGWLLLALACYTAHILLDYFTWGRGVRLFWPVISDRFTAPVTLFYGLHWSQGFISPRHLITIATEIPVAAALVGAARWATSRRPRGGG